MRKEKEDGNIIFQFVPTDELYTDCLTKKVINNIVYALVSIHGLLEGGCQDPGPDPKRESVEVSSSYYHDSICQTLVM
jgi:hypothetical protein